MIPELDALAAAQGGPFTTTQAQALGLTRGQLRHLVREGHLLVLRRGVLLDRDRFPDADLREQHRLDAAAAVLSRSNDARLLVAGHRTAGLLWRLAAPTPPEVGEPPAGDPDWHERPRARLSDALPRTRLLVELISADRSRRNFRWGVHVRPAALEPSDVTNLAGVPITTIERTVVDLARELTHQQALIAADSALRLGACPNRLEEIADRCHTWRGGRQALEVIRFADSRAESAAESLARLVFAEAGLPAPELQVELRDADGLIGRVDLLFRAQRTIVEVDGKIKYTDPRSGDAAEVHWREKLREDRLREAGWEVVRVTWAQLVGSPKEVAARIRAAFARAQRAAG